jgi:hypothetical protein
VEITDVIYLTYVKQNQNLEYEKKIENYFSKKIAKEWEKNRR